MVLQPIVRIVLLLVIVDLSPCLIYKLNCIRGLYGCVRKNSICIRCGTICGFRHPLGVLEHTSVDNGGLLSSELSTELAFRVYHGHTSHNARLLIRYNVFSASPPPLLASGLCLDTCGFGALMLLTPDSGPTRLSLHH